MRSPEQELFELVNETGELLEGDIHIIDTSDFYPEEEGECSYRVYQKQGFCFDIKKIANYNVESGEHIGFEYQFYAEWDGFSDCDANKALEVLRFFQVTRSQD